MDNLNAVFDIETKVEQNLPAPIVLPPKIKPALYDDEDALIQDLKTSRDDFDMIIGQGQQALIEVLGIAQQGQHPRFYEAAAMLIKSLTEANKERMDIHVKLNEIRHKQSMLGGGNKPTNVNVEKAMFFGTTEELQAIMKKKAIEIDGISTDLE